MQSKTMKRLAVCSAIAVALALAATARAGVVIDKFTTDQAELTAFGNNTANGSGMIGVERDVELSEWGGPTSVKVSGGKLSFSGSEESGSSDSIIVIWDGNDADFFDEVTPFSGLDVGGVGKDLTDGGTADTLRIRVLSATDGLGLDLQVWTDDDEFSERGVSLFSAISSPTTIHLPFNDFFQPGAATGGPAQFDCVGLIRLFIIANDADQSIEIDFIDTVPEPGDAWRDGGGTDRCGVAASAKA